ncbi:Ig-like domain repeat protein [Cellulomonas sp. JH27-2]|uniref:immunoglobulin-like domain-containing protein n=1 Tax=Cellulomonas sp. JH27-2 TaxID=2774139 RepID=UPI001786342C|nr:immunoglobulin-like domain-containing protein [Cellulomonas sp. JH27-2]MBD8057482.1 Ig-like domain repeat protein [Cellulomonas sp. JH27-2]
MRISTTTGAVTAIAVALAGVVAATPATAADGPDDGLVARYALDETSGTVAADSSGHGRDGTVLGASTWAGGDGFTFSGGAGGSGNAIDLPDGLLTGLGTVSVDFDVNIDPTLANNYFIFSLGNASDAGYVFVTGKDWEPRLRGAITTGASGELNTIRAGALTTGIWKHLTYTIVGGTVATPGYSVLYEDGVEVARNSAITVKPSDIVGGGTNNMLGRSPWAGDNSFKGAIRDFRVYDRTLTDDERTDLAVDVVTPAVTTDAAALSLGDTSGVTSSLTLPTTGAHGTTVSWASSNPDVVSAAGVVTRPSAATGDTDVTLTATVTRAGVSTTRALAVTVLALPDTDGLLTDALDGVVVPNLGDVRGNLTLPTTGAHGAALTWESADEAVVDATGVVHRPAHGQAATTVDLTVTATLDGLSASRVLTATVPALPEAADPTAYMFAYFEGETTPDGESIYFGASKGNDPTHWADLNDGDPVLTSSFGEKGLRDPFIVRSPEGDKFYLLATDLKIYGGNNFSAAQQNGSTYLEVWESTDLVHWSDQRHVKVSSDYAGNTWAPEAYYDEDLGSYVVYWASNLYPTTDTAGRDYRTSYNRMMYATTRDFVTFSDPKPWIDVKRGTGLGMIDSTVIKDGDTFYRFTKDEAYMIPREERSTDLLATVTGSLPTTTSAPGWQLVKEKVGLNQPNPWGGTFTGGEGPTIFRSNTEERWYLFIDQPSYHGGQGYLAFTSTDLDSGDWTSVPSAQLPSSPRHGTVLPVTQAEYERLLGAYQPDLLVTSVDAQAVTTAQGTAPHLPATATVHYADGSTAVAPVEWDHVAGSSYAAPGTFTVSGTVAAGSQVRAVVTVTVTDDTDPVVALAAARAADGLSGWFRTAPVAVQASATDPSGVSSVELAVDGGAWAATAGSSASTSLSADGLHLVAARATDTTARRSASVNLTVGVDATAPVSRAAVDAARAVSVRAADTTSGVARVEYRLGTTGAWKAYTSAVRIGSAATTVQYRAVDVAGNTEAVNALSLPATGVQLKASVTAATATSSLVYGGSATVVVRVSGAGGVPTGTVRVLEGSAQVASGKLASGRVTLTLTRPTAGTHRLTVVYGGDTRFLGSSDTATVKVTKASSKTKASAASVKASKKAVVKVSVTASKVTPTGQVTVKVTRGGWTYAAKTATLRSGKAQITLPKLAKGTYKVTTTYAGTADITSSKSTTTLVVKR